MLSTGIYFSMAQFARAFGIRRVTWLSQRQHIFQSHSSEKRYSFCLFSTTSNDSGKHRVVFLGTPDVAADSLGAIYNASQEPNADFEVVSVITQPVKRRQRKGKPEPSPVAKMAENLGISVLSPESAKDNDFLDELEAIRPDLCITAAYGQYLPKRFLDMPRLGTVNIHPSLLPRWRGASPVQRSLEAGDNPVGVSILFTVSKMDAGPIIDQQEVTIDDNDTATEVLPMLFKIGTNMLLKAIPDILIGKITMETATPQNENEAIAAPVIDSSEAELKVWQESAKTCHNRLRGFSLWPGVFMYFKVGDREPMKVKITKTRVVPGTSEPTDIVELGPDRKSGLHVVCHDGTILELLEVQPATRKAFPARDFQNGYPGETIRWVRTPDDQANNPEKYNSRKGVANSSVSEEEISLKATDLVAGDEISGSKDVETSRPVSSLTVGRSNPNVRTSPLANFDPSAVSLIPLTEKNVEFTAGIVGGVAGLAVGGPWMGVLVSAAANYASRQQGIATEIVQDISKASLQLINYMAFINAKYEILTNTQSALENALERLKEADVVDTEAVHKVERALENTRNALLEVAQEYDLAGSAVSAFNSLGNLIETTVQAAVLFNADYRLMDKAVSTVKSTVDQAREIAVKAVKED